MPSESSRPPRLPDEVGLYGLSLYTLALTELCRRSGVRVAFVVDGHPERRTVAGGTPAESIRAGVVARAVPVWSAGEFRAAAGGSRVPVVVATIESEPGGDPADDPFLTAAAAVRETAPGLTPWHPASLAGAFGPPAWPGRAALFGFRGSGNVLLQNLLADLVGRLGPGPQEAAWVAGMAEHYFVTVANFLRGRLAGVAREVGYNPDEFPSLFLTAAAAGGGMAAVLNVPSNRHLATPLFHSHSTPSAAAVDEFTRRGVPCFAVVRHPFETVLSLASKTRRPVGPLLDDQPWLERQAGLLAAWLRRALGNAGRLDLVRYEDLVARDAAVLHRVASRVGPGLCRAEVGRLYDRYLFRQLPHSYPGHFRQGGNDKWRVHFGRRHRDVFARHGFRELFAELGYEWPAAAEMAEPAPADGPEEDFPKPAGVVTGPFFLAPGWERLPGPIPYEVRATSPGLRDAVAGAVLADVFTRLLDAGGVGPNPPAWATPIDWEELAGGWRPVPVGVDAPPGRRSTLPVATR